MKGIAVSEEGLLRDLKQVDRQVDGSLTVREYAERGEFGVTTYRRRFGSWNAAKRAADLDTIENEEIQEERLVADLKRVARQVEGSPSEREYRDRGAFGVSTYRRKFGSWNAAKRVADVASTGENDLTNEDLRADLERVAAEIEPDYVTPARYDERGEYHFSALPTDERFWNETFAQLGLQLSPLYYKFVSDTQSEPEINQMSGD